jgi:hypothetical protein
MRPIGDGVGGGIVTGAAAPPDQPPKYFVARLVASAIVMSPAITRALEPGFQRAAWNFTRSSRVMVSTLLFSPFTGRP